MKRNSLIVIGLIIVFGIPILREVGSDLLPEPAPDFAALAEEMSPDWASFAAWPGVEADTAAPDPDPNRETAILVFDDSGSMSSEIGDAKRAALDFARSLPDTTWFGALGLNSGTLVEPSPAPEAAHVLEQVLTRVRADGGTPLGPAMETAHGILKEQAARQRGFGTYRIIVTTDGEANDADVLMDAVRDILKTSPIQISTIGLGIGAGHPLNLGPETTYVAIDNVAQLASALEAVSAEQQSFDPITAFEGGN